MKVKAKKKLGQHFLNDENTVQKIVDAILEVKAERVIELGPGMGVLSKHLYQSIKSFRAIEIDKESVNYLQEYYPNMSVIEADFLKLNLAPLLNHPTCFVGNFPYNISSQIFFKLLEHKDNVPVIIGMVQKEVAQRIAEPKGSKTYGILSVFIQTFYDVEYLFTVNENVFTPPPKVKSAVIKLTRNQRSELPCSEKLFKQVVKTSFGQRRKMLRSSLRPYISAFKDHPFAPMRPEQLSIDDFIELTQLIGGLS